MLGWLVCAAAVGALTYVLVVLFWGRSTERGTSINDFILSDSGEDGEDCCFHYDQLALGLRGRILPRIACNPYHRGP